MLHARKFFSLATRRWRWVSCGRRRSLSNASSFKDCAVAVCSFSVCVMPMSLFRFIQDTGTRGKTYFKILGAFPKKNRGCVCYAKRMGWFSKEARFLTSHRAFHGLQMKHGRSLATIRSRPTRLLSTQCTTSWLKGRPSAWWSSFVFCPTKRCVLCEKTSVEVSAFFEMHGFFDGISLIFAPKWNTELRIGKLF